MNKPDPLKRKGRHVPDNISTQPVQRQGWWLFTGLVIMWLLWMTSRPGGAVHGLNLIPFAEHSRALVCLLNDGCPYQRRAFWLLLINVVGNVLVFVPLGIGLAGLWYKGNGWQTFRRAVLGGFLLSLTIEMMQLAIPSRATDVDDLVFNTLGAILGVLAFLGLQQLILNRSRVARQQAN